MHRFSVIKALFLSLVFLPLAGCLKTSHPAAMRMSTAVLKEASREQLVETINSESASLQTFIASVDIDFSNGGKKKGQVTDYAELSGTILVRKPTMLRMQVKLPLVRNTALDMVSNGKTFEVSFPPKNQFFVGSSQFVGAPSENPLENLRPQVILDALLLRPIDETTEEAVLEQSNEIVTDRKTHKQAEQSNYVLIVLAKDPAGAYLSRKIFFSREDLMPHSQAIYDRAGQLVTYAHYENFTDHSGIMFPDVIDIQRPVEELSFRLTVTKLRLNEPIQDAQFKLEQPPGSKRVDLDHKNISANPGVEPKSVEPKRELDKGPQ